VGSRRVRTHWAGLPQSRLEMIQGRVGAAEDGGARAPRETLPGVLGPADRWSRPRVSRGRGLAVNEVFGGRWRPFPLPKLPVAGWSASLLDGPEGGGGPLAATAGKVGPGSGDPHPNCPWGPPGITKLWQAAVRCLRGRRRGSPEKHPSNGGPSRGLESSGEMSLPPPETYVHSPGELGARCGSCFRPERVHPGGRSRTAPGSKQQ
jgi:hypothetical protein